MSKHNEQSNGLESEEAQNTWVVANHADKTNTGITGEIKKANMAHDTTGRSQIVIITLAFGASSRLWHSILPDR